MLNRVIHHLKTTKGFVSGEELSRVLGITRSAVWKHIEEMRAKGYALEAVPRRGYRLVSSPDRLSSAEVRAGLQARIFGGDVRHFDTLDSTMDEAFRAGMAGAPEGTVVVAETQTRGRGRMGRAWSSPKGKGLYFSLVLRPRIPVAEVSRLTLLAAVAVSDAVENVTGAHPLIKWPNDLLLDGKKLCGILTELRAEVERVEFVVMGIGLNVNAAAFQLVPGAVSLRQVTGKTFARVALLQEILCVFEKEYFLLAREGYGHALRKWKKRSATLGRQVRFEDRGVLKEGTAVDLADDGGLWVRLDSGEVVKRIAGDIDVRGER